MLLVPVESTQAVLLFPIYAASHLLRSVLLSFKTLISSAKMAISPAIPRSIIVLNRVVVQPTLFDCFVSINVFAAVFSFIFTLSAAISV